MFALSVGISAFPEHGSREEISNAADIEILRAADIALYRAKHDRRNRVVVADQ